jgi:hypothetical protein
MCRLCISVNASTLFRLILESLFWFQTWFQHLFLLRPDLDSLSVFDFFSAIPLSARPVVRSSGRGRRVTYMPTLVVTVSNVVSRRQVRRHYESTILTTTDCRWWRVVVVDIVFRWCCRCLHVVEGLRLLLRQIREHISIFIYICETV